MLEIEVSISLHHHYVYIISSICPLNKNFENSQYQQPKFYKMVLA